MKYRLPYSQKCAEIAARKLAARKEEQMQATTQEVLQIAQEIVDSDSPRKRGFNYGGGNTTPLPAEYATVARMHGIAQTLAHEAQRVAWDLSERMRNMRLAETPTEREVARRALEDAIGAISVDLAEFATKALILSHEDQRV